MRALLFVRPVTSIAAFCVEARALHIGLVVYGGLAKVDPEHPLLDEVEARMKERFPVWSRILDLEGFREYARERKAKESQ